MGAAGRRRRSFLSSRTYTYLGEDHVGPVRRGDHEHLHLRRVVADAEAAARVAYLVVLLAHPVRHAPAIHPWYAWHTHDSMIQQTTTMADGAGN